VRRAQRLRFEVFNLELNEGLAESHFTGLDADPFDAVCDHLLVEEVITGEIVGTYRLQTGTQAASNIGYYSEREFDFTPYQALRAKMIELGRACVHSEHRNFNLLHLLWRGIALYAREHGAQFLVGCSSLTSQHPSEGIAMYQRLFPKFLVRPEWRTLPRPEFVAGGADAGFSSTDDRIQPESTPPATTLPRVHGGTSLTVPKLMRAYLGIGAKICGPPAIDREFGTIDFLTLLDLQALPSVVRAHFFK
jgi:putative hemolysin